MSSLSQASRKAMAAYFVVFGMAMCFTSMAALAQTIGEVEFARGVGFAQSSGQMPRTLGKGLTLQEGDRVTTAEGAAAIVRLQDGTKMTVRPNSEMVIQQFRFKDAASDNSMVMHLLRGGFRAITGLIAKSSPDAAKVRTSTATLGIRGTDFDARICNTDCKVESAKVPDKPHANTVLASAKLVSVQGEVFGVDPGGQRRRLVVGGSVYNGETLETGADTKAVIAFRDDSRMTLGSSTRFRLDNFIYDEQNPGQGRFLVSLLRGSLRALTGLIGKANTRNVGFHTPTATIGIRGTGLDMDCSTDTSCSFYTWLGSIEVAPNGRSALQVLLAGEGLFVSPSEIRSISTPTLQNLPRPDSVPVDVRQLFSSGGVSDGQEGLYVFVRDGHIEVMTGSETLHLGRGETGFAGPDGRALRPVLTPLFLEFDRTPMPNSRNPMLSSLISDPNGRSSLQCK